MRIIKLLALSLLSPVLALAPVGSRKADQFEPVRERIREKLVQQRVPSIAVAVARGKQSKEGAFS